MSGRTLISALAIALLFISGCYGEKEEVLSELEQEIAQLKQKREKFQKILRREQLALRKIRRKTEELEQKNRELSEKIQAYQGRLIVLSKKIERTQVIAAEQDCRANLEGFRAIFLRDMNKCFLKEAQRLACKADKAESESTAGFFGALLGAAAIALTGGAASAVVAATAAGGIGGSVIGSSGYNCKKLERDARKCFENLRLEYEKRKKNKYQLQLLKNLPQEPIYSFREGDNSRPYIGVILAKDTGAVKLAGVMTCSHLYNQGYRVVPDRDDYLISIDGKPISSANNLLETLRGYRPGSFVNVVIRSYFTENGRRYYYDKNYRIMLGRAKEVER